VPLTFITLPSIWWVTTYTAKTPTAFADEQPWAGAVDAIAAARDELPPMLLPCARPSTERRCATPWRSASRPLRCRLSSTRPSETRMEIALEDAQAARDDVGECVLDLLAALRSRRAELAPHFRSSAQICWRRSQGASHTAAAHASNWAAWGLWMFKCSV
jgi:hypothetical protein